MTERGTVDNWLAGLAAAAGFDGLQLDERGCAALRYADDLDLMLELPEASPVLHLYAPVLELADSAGQDVFRRVLALNLFGVETQGASFALDELNDRIVLQYPLLVEATDAGQFERVLGNFIEAAQRWKRELAAPDAPAAADEPPSAPEPLAFNTMMLRI
jgi:hypothetical protein